MIKNGRNKSGGTSEFKTFNRSAWYGTSKVKHIFKPMCRPANKANIHKGGARCFEHQAKVNIISKLVEIQKVKHSKLTKKKGRRF